jgi:hypothetical protein
MARSLRWNVENALHVVVCLYVTLISTLSINSVLGLTPFLGKLTTIYMLLIVIPGCTFTCLTGPFTSQVMKAYVESRKHREIDCR